MFVNIHHDTAYEHRRLAVAGLVFVAALALLVSLSIAVYSKAFSNPVMVTIKADRAGLQLAKFGDVRINGALVGQVRSVSQDGQHASIDVALDPALARDIPADASVRILPTTLFGQKFIEFVRPAHPSGRGMYDGEVIPAARVRTNVELSQVLAELFPLLRAVRPADLSATLNALATALDGRGDELGATAIKLDRFLGVVSGDLPALRRNLSALADVAHTYAGAAPDIVGVLRNVTVTSRTIVARQADLRSFLGDVTGVSDDAYSLMNANGDAIVRVGQLSVPLTRLLATYAPEYPCLLKGLDRYRSRLVGIFRGGVVKQRMELGVPQYHVYTPAEKPVYGEVGHGPWCDGLPYPAEPALPHHFNDGTLQDDDPPTSPLPVARTMSMGYAGTPGDKAIINALLASRTGEPADRYGSLPALMYGPVVRGAA